MYIFESHKATNGGGEKRLGSGGVDNCLSKHAKLKIDYRNIKYEAEKLC